MQRSQTLITKPASIRGSALLFAWKAAALRRKMASNVTQRDDYRIKASANGKHSCFICASVGLLLEFLQSLLESQALHCAADTKCNLLTSLIFFMTMLLNNKN